MKIKIEPGDVIVEIFSIVVAILLALAVNGWQSNVHRRDILRSNVANIVAELNANAEHLAPLARRHDAIEREILRVSSTLRTRRRISNERYDAMLARAIPHGLGVLQLQDIAWQIAQNDRALELMPYPQRAALSLLYQRQADLRAAYTRVLEDVEASGPSDNAYFTLRALALNFGDVVAAESDLSHAYAPLVAQLSAAYGLNARR